MKILVLSDSHGDIARMEQAIALEQPDTVIHLGDCLPDAQALRERHPGLTVYGVPGNCDGKTSLPEVLTVTLGGVKFLLTHGHRHHVKFSPLRLALDAESQGANVALFGHTHSRLCKQRGALWLLNPGSCCHRLTYGVVTVEDGQAVCTLNEETIG